MGTNLKLCHLFQLILIAILETQIIVQQWYKIIFSQWNHEDVICCIKWDRWQSKGLSGFENKLYGKWFFLKN
jgi:hypothetical protein